MKKKKTKSVSNEESDIYVRFDRVYINNFHGPRNRPKNKIILSKKQQQQSHAPCPMDKPPLPSNKTLWTTGRIYAFGLTNVTTVLTDNGSVSQLSKKSLNKKSVSYGPPAASGWNWTENIFFDVWIIPSFDISVLFFFVNQK